MRMERKKNGKRFIDDKKAGVYAVSAYIPTFFFSAEGGVRTHVPLRTNGFQDRLVMTTSIPLQ